MKRLKMLCTAVILISLVNFSHSLAKYDYYDNVPPSQNPPGGLTPSQVPMFVTIGSDDNYKSGWEGSEEGGIKWIMDFLNSKTNPEGSGNIKTYDGTPCRVSFFSNSIYITQSTEQPVLLKKAWNTLYKAGYEMGNHTHSHPHGSAFSATQWEDSIKLCNDWFIKPFDQNETTPDDTKGPGIPFQISLDSGRRI